MTKEELEKENQKLKEKITNLDNKIKKEIAFNKRKDQILFEQSKMASLGEMLGNIAHQWRQPLMEISSIFMLLQSKIEFGEKISNEVILDSISKSDEILKHLSQTIEDFRGFLKKEKEKENFRISTQISKAISILNNSFKKENIKVEIIIHKNSVINGLKNEYLQVLINILCNAKYELLKRKVSNPKIIIKVNEIDNVSIVEILDNAGGVKVKPLEKIFEPFFTSGKTDGTGIGLFMSKLIIENSMKGSLSVENKLNGACFKIKLDSSKC